MATYTATKQDVIAPGSFAATELFSKVGGFIAGCGQAALAVILGAAKGKPLGWQDVTTLIQESVNAHVTVGKLAASGQSAPSTLEYLAQANGVQLTSLDYRSALAFAGQRDVILGVSNASAFGGSDSNVAGHYITVVGVQGGNYIVSDPNTQQSTKGQYVVYTPQQIADAQPFWAAVPTNAPSATTATPQSSNIGIPNIGAGISIPGLSNITDFFGTVGAWFTPPTRALKFITGLMLIFTSLVLAFLPDIAAATASATGNPEVGAAILSTGRGPKGAAGAGIRAIGTASGRQRTATRQEFRAQRATATVRLQQRQDADQARARTMERARKTAQRAATTRNMGAQTRAYTAAGTPPQGGAAASPSSRFAQPNPNVIGRTGLHKNEPVKKAKKSTAAPTEESNIEAVAKARGESVGAFLKLPVSERKKALESYQLGAKTVVTKQPIPDSRVERVKRLIRKKRTP